MLYNVIHLYFNNCSIVLSWWRVGGSDNDKQPCYSRWGKGWPLKNGWILAELLVLFSYKLTGWFLLLLNGYWSVNHHKPEKYSSAAMCYSHTWHFSNCKEQTHKNIAQQHTWHLSICQEKTHSEASSGHSQTLVWLQVQFLSLFGCCQVPAQEKQQATLKRRQMERKYDTIRGSGVGETIYEAIYNEQIEEKQ